MCTKYHYFVIGQKIRHSFTFSQTKRVFFFFCFPRFFLCSSSSIRLCCIIFSVFDFYFERVISAVIVPLYNTYIYYLSTCHFACHASWICLRALPLFWIFASSSLLLWCFLLNKMSFFIIYYSHIRSAVLTKEITDKDNYEL